MTTSLDFLVNRSDLRDCATEAGQQSAETPLQPDQVLIGIDHFAFTANNVTYAAVADMIGYWNFFPAPPGRGRIPVWGFGDVLASRCAALPVGERIYGYLPMSTHVVLDAARVTDDAFVDAAPHRAALPPVYNQYTRTAAAGVPRADEPRYALFRPLFATAFLLDDLLAETDAFGARRILLTSASSKTALGLAFLLSARGGCEVIGLTSAANVPFVERTGYYTTVLPYEAVESLTPEAPIVAVDFAGNGALLARVHGHFGDRLQHSAQVGVTHWERMTAPASLPGPAPVFFFAPARVDQRIADWGAAELWQRIAAAMQRFSASTTWLRIITGRGPAAVESVYRAMLDGRVDPAEGHILSLRS